MQQSLIRLSALCSLFGGELGDFLGERIDYSELIGINMEKPIKISENLIDF